MANLIMKDGMKYANFAFEHNKENDVCSLTPMDNDMIYSNVSDEKTCKYIHEFSLCDGKCELVKTVGTVFIGVADNTNKYVNNIAHTLFYVYIDRWVFVGRYPLSYGQILTIIMPYSISNLDHNNGSIYQYFSIYGTLNNYLTDFSQILFEPYRANYSYQDILITMDDIHFYILIPNPHNLTIDQTESFKYAIYAILKSEVFLYMCAIMGGVKLDITEQQFQTSLLNLKKKIRKIIKKHIGSEIAREVIKYLY